MRWFYAEFTNNNENNSKKTKNEIAYLWFGWRDRR
jgi:hypothetical protein